MSQVFLLPTTSTLTAQQTSATAVPNLAAQSISLANPGGSVRFTLAGTFVGTVQFEWTTYYNPQDTTLGAANDPATNWQALTVYPVAGGAGVTSATGTGTWAANTQGYGAVRVRCSAFTSGSIIVITAIAPDDDSAAGGGGGVSTNIASVGGVSVPAGVLPELPPNIEATGSFAPAQLFDMTTRQAGTTQKGLIFPTTIACTLPALGTGAVANITNSSNVCGGAFAPDQRWDSVFLDFAAQGQNAADTITVEIGRIKKSTGIAELLASVVLTASSTTLAVSVDPFTGAAHAAATWRFFDVTAITSYSGLGDVLQALGGTSGNLSQLKLNCHDVAFYYVQITAFADGGTRTTEVICDITPTS